MDSYPSMLPYPVYLGSGYSHGSFVPPQQIRLALRSLPRPAPPQLSRGLRPAFSTTSVSTDGNCASLTFHVCLFSREGEDRINSPAQTLLDLEPASAASTAIPGFTLYVTYTGHIGVRVKQQDFLSTESLLARNTWYRICLVFDQSRLQLVLVSGKLALRIPSEAYVAPPPAPSSSPSPFSEPVQHRKVEESKTNNIWPFGPLILGNNAVALSSVDKTDTNWTHNVCHGAIEGLQVKIHAITEFLALLRLFDSATSPSHVVNRPLSLNSQTDDIVDLKSHLGTLEDALCEVSNHFPLPPPSFPLPSRVCRPLFSVAELDNWQEYLSAFSPLRLSAFKPMAKRPREPTTGPKVILCHDFKGGYFKDNVWERNLDYQTQDGTLADQLDQRAKHDSHLRLYSRDGAPLSLTSYIPEVYTFQHWVYVDMFVYFSHYRITIPPVALIQAAHQNGVEVLGTLIMEWTEGSLDTKRIVAGKPDDRLFYARKLVEICEKLSFDGWLVNIEHTMTEGDIRELVAWLKDFRRLLNEKAGFKLVWYDSVIDSGELKWQSGLTPFNYAFFENCDYFFTDYHWKEGNLTMSRANAQAAANRVFVGIDVWGRGTYGGGGWNTPVALKAITEHHLPHDGHGAYQCRPTDSDQNSARQSDPPFSVALFGTGWTIESQADSIDSLHDNEAKFWIGHEQWNLFSDKFKTAQKTYFRQYLRNKDDPNDFSVEDILSSFEYSSDGVVGKAEEEAAAYSSISQDARFPSLPQLYAPRMAGSQWTWRHIRFDFAESGIDVDYLDRQQPPLTLSVWLKSQGPNYADSFRLRVLLLDQHLRCLGEFDSGVITTSKEWKQLRHMWAGYPAGVRTIIWLDGGKDAEGWAGFYGCIVDRPTILIPNPERIPAIATYIEARKPKMKLPLVSTFDVGEGTALYSNGAPLEYKLPPGTRWYNLAAQSLIPSLDIDYQAIGQFFSPEPSLKSSVMLNCRTIASTETNIIKHIYARIVDASSVDGGVWQGSSCLQISGSVALPSPPSTTTSTEPSPRGEIQPDASTTHPDVPVVQPPRRRRSSRVLEVKGSNPGEMAHVALYPLNLDSSTSDGPPVSFTLQLVFRAGHLPPNVLLMATIRRRKSNGEKLDPLSWDLLHKDNRDPDAQSSSFGWIHFSATWYAEEGVIYDQLGISVVALSSSLHPTHAHSLSPRSPRVSLGSSGSTHPTSSSSSSAPSAGQSTSPQAQQESISLLIGLVRLSHRLHSAASVIPAPPPSVSSQVSQDASKSTPSPLNLGYKLTWSQESLNSSESTFFTLTAYWKAPPAPPTLSHLGPPHFIVTATQSYKNGEDAPPVTRVLCQGRTWNESWEVPRLVASGDLVFTVSTVYPDYTHPSHLHDRIKIAWPQNDLL